MTTSGSAVVESNVGFLLGHDQNRSDRNPPRLARSLDDQRRPANSRIIRNPPLPGVLANDGFVPGLGDRFERGQRRCASGSSRPECDVRFWRCEHRILTRAVIRVASVRLTGSANEAAVQRLRWRPPNLPFIHDPTGGRCRIISVLSSSTSPGCMKAWSF